MVNFPEQIKKIFFSSDLSLEDQAMEMHNLNQSVQNEALEWLRGNPNISTIPQFNQLNRIITRGFAAPSFLERIISVFSRVFSRRRDYFSPLKKWIGSPENEENKSNLVAFFQTDDETLKVQGMRFLMACCDSGVLASDQLYKLLKENPSICNNSKCYDEKVNFLFRLDDGKIRELSETVFLDDILLHIKEDDIFKIFDKLDGEAIYKILDRTNLADKIQKKFQSLIDLATNGKLNQEQLFNLLTKKNKYEKTPLQRYWIPAEKVEELTKEGKIPKSPKHVINFKFSSLVGLFNKEQLLELLQVRQDEGLPIIFRPINLNQVLTSDLGEITSEELASLLQTKYRGEYAFNKRRAGLFFHSASIASLAEKLEPEDLYKVLSLQNDEGQTPLHARARYNESIDDIISLVPNKLSKNQLYSLLTIQDRHWCNFLNSMYCNYNRLEWIEKLLSQEVLDEDQITIILTQKNSFGTTPYQLWLKDNREIVKRLIQKEENLSKLRLLG